MSGVYLRWGAQGFFLLLFPVFFFYHTAAGAHLIPYFFGQWWSLWNAIGAVIFGGALLLGHKDWSRWEAGLLVLVVTILGYGAYYRAFGEPFQGNNEAAIQSLKLAAGLVCLYGVGRYMGAAKGSSTIFVAGLGIVVATFAMMDPETLVFIARNRFTNIDAATYQSFAQAFSFTLIFCLAFLAPRKAAIIAGLGLPTLYVLSSRSDMIAMAPVIAAWAAVCIWKHRNWRDVLLAAAVALLVAVAMLGTQWIGVRAHLDVPQSVFGPDSALPPIASAAPTASAMEPSTSAVTTGQAEAAPQNRQLELLDPAESESVQHRIALLRDGVSQIIQSPIFGVYAGQMKNHGKFGYYVHNAISAWHNYGLVAFLVYLSLSAGALFTTARDAIARNVDDPALYFALYASVFALVSIVLAKSVYWPLPALAWGAAAAWSLRRKSTSIG